MIRIGHIIIFSQRITQQSFVKTPGKMKQKMTMWHSSGFVQFTKSPLEEARGRSLLKQAGERPIFFMVLEAQKKCKYSPYMHIVLLNNSQQCLGLVKLRLLVMMLFLLACQGMRLTTPCLFGRRFLNEFCPFCHYSANSCESRPISYTLPILLGSFICYSIYRKQKKTEQRCKMPICMLCGEFFEGATKAL